MSASLFALRESAVIAAGAGTGKTHSLVTLCLHLLGGAGRSEPLPAARLCAITFTEKAAAELKSRLRARVDALAEGAPQEPELSASYAEASQAPPAAAHWQKVRRDLGTAQIGTIHSLCAQILRRNAAAAGISPGFQVLAEIEARALLRDACEAAALEALQNPASALREGAERLCAELGLRSPGRFQQGLAEILMRILNTAAESGLPPLAADAQAALAAEAAARAGLARSFAQLRAAALSRGKPELVVLANRFAAEGLSLLQAAAPGELPFAWDRLGPLCDPGGARGALGDDIGAVKEAVKALLDADAGVREARLLHDLASLAQDAQARHRERKRRAAALDFDDLTRLSLELLARVPQARSAEKQRLDALLVDEFQDTSRAQLALFAWLAEAPDADGSEPGPIPPGRLVLVGDRKQSIYEFRGADVASAQAFASRALEGGARSHTLRRSRRSRPALVRFANALFARALAEGGLPFRTPWIAGEDDLEPHRPESAAGPCAELIEVDAKGEGAVQEEANKVARRIALLLDANAPERVLEPGPHGETPRPVRGGDVAILLRAFTHVDAYRRALLGRRIPHLVWRGRGFFASREVADLIALLQLTADPDDVRALAAVLRSPLGLVSDEGLLLLARGPRSSRDGTPHTGRGLSRHALVDPVALSALADDDAQAVRRIAALLARLHEEAALLGPAALLEEALEATDYAAAIASGLHGEQGAANVGKLVALARAAELSGRTLREFLTTVQGLTDEEAREADASVVEERDQHAVRILTVHAAKGLEFPVVFVPECGAPSQLGGEPSLLLDPDLGASLRVRGADGAARRGPLGRAVRERVQAREAAQARRLLYVAATRARDLVVFSARPARRDGTWRRWLDELAGSPGGAELLRVVTAASLLPLPSPPVPALADRHPALLAALQAGRPGSPDLAAGVEGARLPALHRQLPPLEGETVIAPVTQLADAVLCARRYQLLHELGLPERPGAVRDAEHSLDKDPAELGTLAHRLLERAAGTGADLRALLVEECADPDSAESREVTLAVERLLASPLGARLAAAPAAHLHRELPFALLLPARPGAPELLVRGQIDALLLEGDGALVLDYKLAQEHPSPRYELQLDAYALAAHELVAGTVPVRTALVWLRSQNPEPRLRPALDEASRAALRVKLQSAAAAIAEGRRSGEFPLIAADRCRAIGCGFLQRCHGRATPPPATRGQLALPL